MASYHGSEAEGHKGSVKFCRTDGPEAQQATYNHELNQKRAVTLLFVGALCGLLGFLFAGLLGGERYLYEGEEVLMPSGKRGHVHLNYLGQQYPSKRNYSPQTVSEMVYNIKSPEGKSFLAFCVVGAICILMSWYPWQLRNVYIGDDAVIFGCCGPTWLNVRQYFPPIGMLLVALIPACPPVNRTFGDKVTVTLHTLGAVLMIGGYAVCEIFTLFFSQNADRRLGVHFKPGEKFVRAVLIFISLACGIGFQVAGAVAPAPRDFKHAKEISCADIWVVPDSNDLAELSRNFTATQDGKYTALMVYAAEAMSQNQRLLYDTADGRCLTIKRLEYWFEVFAGMFMIFSHLAIWYYCPERHLDLPERLPDLSKKELRKQGYDDDYVEFGYGSDGYESASDEGH